MPSFDGVFYRRPAVAVKNDLSGLVTSALSPGGVLGIVGASDAGDPNKAIRFSDANLAAEYFRGGPLIDAANAAWTHGASSIYLVRAGNPTQATLTLVSSTSANLVTFKSIDYGSYTNNISIKVEAGTTSGVKVSMMFEDNGRAIIDFVDNADTVDTIVNYFNSVTQLDYITAEKIADGTPALIGYTPLQGGSGDGNVTLTLPEWQTGFDRLASEYVNIVHPAGSTDPVVHALVQTHVMQLSNQNMERIGVVGGGLGEPIGDVNTPNTYAWRAYNLNNDRMVLVGPGTDGKSPALTAAKVMGLLAAYDVAEPLVYKTVQATDIEVKWNRTQIDDLIKYGVTAIEQAQSGRRVVRDITTYQDPDEYNERPTKTLSYRRIIDYCTENIRNILDITYIGHKGFGVGTASDIASTVITTLGRFIENEIISNFRNVTCIQSPDDPRVYLVNYEVSPVSPILWVFITQRFVGAIE